MNRDFAWNGRRRLGSCSGRLTLAAMLALSLAGTARAEGMARLCASLLATSDFLASDVVEPGQVEAAVTNAWSDLISDALSMASPAKLPEWKLWLSEVAVGSSGFDLPAHISESAASEGLDHLSLMVESVAAAGRIDRALLNAKIANHARSLMKGDEDRGRVQEEGKQGRRRARVPKLQIPLGGRSGTAPVQLADGRILATNGESLVFFDADGKELSRVSVPGFVSSDEILPQADGGWALGTYENAVVWFDALGNVTAEVSLPDGLRAIRLLQLRDGRIAVSTRGDGAACIVDRSGAVVKIASEGKDAEVRGQLPDGRVVLSSTFLAPTEVLPNARAGELLLVPTAKGQGRRRKIPLGHDFDDQDALILRDGRIFVAGKSGKTAFVDPSSGEVVPAASVGYRGVGEPTQLSDGGIVLGLDDGVAVLNEDGTLRAKIPCGTDPRTRAMTTAPKGLSNGIVAIGGGDAKLRFLDPAGKVLWSIELGPWTSRYDGIRAGLLEVRDEDGVTLVFLSMLDGTVMRVDLDYYIEQLAAHGAADLK